jgi:DNA-binding IclR family transcriptional regulator
MSSRKSNSVLRAVALLHLLADDPSRAWSLADIARQTDMSYASAHSVAGALEDSGYVRRHPRTRTYTLGPSLIALGSAARRGYQKWTFAPTIWYSAASPASAWGTTC